MKKFFLTLIIASTLTTLTQAQDYSADQRGERQRDKVAIAPDKTPKVEKPFVQSKHEFGVATGLTTGYGISYRYWPKKIGFQFTTFPVVSSGEKNLSLGLIGLYELDAKRWYRFYVFAGGNFNWTENKPSATNVDNFNSTDETPLDWIFNLNSPDEEQKSYTAGFGPGIEFTPAKHFGVNLMTGFRYNSIDKAVSKDVWSYTLTADIAVYIRF